MIGWFAINTRNIVDLKKEGRAPLLNGNKHIVFITNPGTGFILSRRDAPFSRQ